MTVPVDSYNAASQPTVYVIATTFEGTRAALVAAVPLARGSRARLVVIVPRVVPYPADLGASSDGDGFFAKHYGKVVEGLGGEARIEICVCRGVDEMVSHILPPDSQVVVGGPAGRWLTSPEERFAGRLIRLGRRVIFAASGWNTTQRRSAAAMFAFAAALVAPLAGMGTWAM
jgi:hypothetical protein